MFRNTNFPRSLRIVILIALFPGGAGLSAQELYRMPKRVISGVSSFENLNGVKGAGGTSNHHAKGNAFERIKAGESKTLLDIHSAGIINRIWLTIQDRSAIMLRSLRLRMFWDQSNKAAVDVPLGDFFCAGLGIPTPFQSALFTNPEGRSFNCYIPMPFKKGARVIITNESGIDLNFLFFDIDFILLAKPPADILYFHGFWNRSVHAALGEDFELLPSLSGKGRFLGVNIGINLDSGYGQSWWGEGEVKMYLDGDKANPTINGTGTEDYIGGGWGVDRFANLYQGCTIADPKNRQYAFYRFHIPDPVYFQKNIRVTIQEMGGAFTEEVIALQARSIPLIPVSVSKKPQFYKLLENPQPLTSPEFEKGWMNFYRVDDYSATTYFYLDKPFSKLPGLSPVTERTR